MKTTFRLIFVLFFCTSFAVVAEVETMSLEHFKDVNGERYWEVTLKCSAESDEKVIKRTVGRGNPWCSVDNTSVCNENKFTLSRMLCPTEGSIDTQIAKKPKNNDKVSSKVDLSPAKSAVADSNKTRPEVVSSASKNIKRSDSNNSSRQAVSSKPNVLGSSSSSTETELLREQVQIEEQRIQIEQRRLQLLQIELELKKQKLN